MSNRVEKWALVVMLLAGCVLLIGEVIDQDWARAGIWVVAVALVSMVLLRRRRQHSAN